jgi:ubiquinone/menaquinone biosynthesis C-methylase UbiE
MSSQIQQIDTWRTAVVKSRYDRVAPIYDLVEKPMERGSFSRWREELWSLARGPRILEVGVGTGKSFPLYPVDVELIAIDFSPKMLARAQRRAAREGRKVDLRLMDVQQLGFPDGSFDSVVGSFVFCSVPDPLLGLRQLGRVTRPGGTIALLEHVRPEGPAGRVADFLNPLLVRLWGANMNRRTVENVRRAGLQVKRVEDLWAGIVKLIVAASPGSPTPEVA